MAMFSTPWASAPRPEGGDRFHVVERNRRAVGLEVQEVAQGNRRQAVLALGVFLVGGVGVGGAGGLQDVDQPAVMLVRLAAAAVAIEATDRQRHHVLVHGPAVDLDHHALDARQPNARDARRHAREELVDQRAAEPDRLEGIAAAVRADDRDANL
jgi:hypothetical protein